MSDVIVQVPLGATVPLPILIVPPLNNSILAPDWPVPVKVGVVSEVISSVLDVPLSLFSVKSSAEGATRSDPTIIVRGSDELLTLPALSVALAVIACTPSPILDIVICQCPLESASPLPPMTSPELKISTYAPGSAIPLKVGVESEVRLSVCEVPVSLELVRSGLDGELIAESIVTVNVPEREL